MQHKNGGTHLLLYFNILFYVHFQDLPAAFDIPQNFAIYPILRSAPARPLTATIIVTKELRPVKYYITHYSAL